MNIEVSLDLHCFSMLHICFRLPFLRICLNEGWLPALMVVSSRITMLFLMALRNLMRRELPSSTYNSLTFVYSLSGPEVLTIIGE